MKLQLEFVDLYLIHSPHNVHNRCHEWVAMEDLKDTGKARSIGVSNYGTHHIDELLGLPGLRHVPAVNQVELNPYITRTELVAHCAKRGIIMEAYSPLTKAQRLHDPKLLAIAVGSHWRGCG